MNKYQAKSNINWKIGVKLNEAGLGVWRDAMRNIPSPHFDNWQPPEAKNGYHWFQLWDFATLFGSYLTISREMIMDTEYLVEVE